MPEGSDPSIDQLSELINSSNSPKTIFDLLSVLPESYRDNYTLMHQSNSLQAASYENPRVIMYGDTADLILAFNGNKSQKGFDVIEAIQWREETKEFEFYEITMSDQGLKISDKNPDKCKDCHTEDLRPNWETYPFWVGSFGSHDDDARSRFDETKELKPYMTNGARMWYYHPAIVEDDLEATKLKSFISRVKEGDLKSSRYSLLADLESNYKVTMLYSALPNLKLTVQLFQKNYKRIAKEIVGAPFYKEYKYIITALVADCFTKEGHYKKLYDGQYVTNDFEEKPLPQPDVDGYLVDEKFPKIELPPNMPEKGPGSFGYNMIRDRLLLKFFKNKGLDTSNWSTSFKGTTEQIAGSFTTPGIGYSLFFEALLEADPNLRQELREAGKLQSQSIKSPAGLVVEGNGRFTKPIQFDLLKKGSCEYLKSRSQEVLGEVQKLKQAEKAKKASLPDDCDDKEGIIPKNDRTAVLRAQHASLFSECIDCHGSSSDSKKVAPRLTWIESLEDFKIKASDGKLQKDLEWRLSEKAGQDRMPPRRKWTKEEREFLRKFFKDVNSL